MGAARNTLLTRLATIAVGLPLLSPVSVTAAERVVQIIEDSNGNFRFVPDKLEIKAGDTVKWENMTAATHNVTPKASFTGTGPAELPATKTHSTVVTDPIHQYLCTRHPSTMQGTIAITASP